MSQDLIFGTHQDSKIEQSGAIINGFVECFLGHVCPTSETARKHKDVSLLGITARYPYQWRIQDFPGGGGQLLFGINFIENCVKMKNIGLRGGASFVPLPRSAIAH